MAVDMFLKLGDIDGESTDDKHKGEIEVLSFSWGISDTSRTAATPGRLSPARKTAIHDFSIVKYLDKSSPKLFLGCCEGTHIPEASFSLVNKDTRQDYYKVKLSDVLISSVAPGGAVGGNTAAMEQVSFSFASVQITAVSLGPDGKPQETQTVACGGSMSFDDGGDVIIKR